jgi:hypothetical protein
VHVLAAAFVLVELSHLFGLFVGQFIVGDDVLVFVPDGALVVDVDTVFDVPPGLDCKYTETVIVRGTFSLVALR